jgi:hypothetical protein
MYIRQVQAPSKSDCTYAADPTQLHIQTGMLDLAISRRYWATLLIGNQLIQQGSAELVRSETSRIVVNEAEVQVETSRGETIGEAFRVPGTGFADPSTANEPGWGLFQTILIDYTRSEMIRKMAGFSGDMPINKTIPVVAVVRLFGNTLGGTDIESAEYRFPIEVCYGCLVSFTPEGVDDAAAVVPNCQKALAAGATLVSACIAGQDQLLDCRICHLLLGKNSPICEPPPP